MLKFTRCFLPSVENRPNGHLSKWPPWNRIKSNISGTNSPIGLISTPKHTKSMTIFLVEHSLTMKYHDVIIKIQDGCHQVIKIIYRRFRLAWFQRQNILSLWVIHTIRSRHISYLYSTTWHGNVSHATNSNIKQLNIE